MAPVHLNEPLTTLASRKYKLPGIVYSEFYRQVREGNEKREFVGRSEIVLCEHMLNVLDEAKLVLGRRAWQLQHAMGLPLRPVVSLVRNYPTHATARVIMVLFIPWYQMNMQVRNRLPGCSAVLDADVIASRRVVFLD